MLDTLADRTVLVTGATGFIAKHIVLQLLEAGHRVRGSVRNTAKADAFRQTLKGLLTDPEALARLEFVPLDLESDQGWDAALTGVDVLMHTASPFPMVQPDDPQAAIRPAVDGTRRALEAAARNGVNRVILTSSVVAIMAQNRPAGFKAFDETDWSDTEGPIATPYAKSKTLAEQAAWDLADKHGLQLTTINPSLVLGPPLDGAFGTSIKVIVRLMRKQDPMLPRMGFSVVDVRDIAAMHVAAMERDSSIGHRIIGATDFLWFNEVAREIEVALPGTKLRKTVAPDAVVRALAIFDKSIRGIIPSLGRAEKLSNEKARDLLGIELRDARAVIHETAQKIREMKLA